MANAQRALTTCATSHPSHSEARSVWWKRLRGSKPVHDRFQLPADFGCQQVAGAAAGLITETRYPQHVEEAAAGVASAQRALMTCATSQPSRSVRAESGTTRDFYEIHVQRLEVTLILIDMCIP